jgi:hypothetical protein
MTANLAARVLDHIKRQPHQPVTFLDLANAFPADFRDGTRSLRLHQDQTIVVWHCVTDAAIQAIEELMAAELVIVTASPQVKWLYVCEGGSVPALPVARPNRSYKTPHWLPVTIMAGAVPASGDVHADE